MTQTIDDFPTFLVAIFYQPENEQLFKAEDFAYPRAPPCCHWPPATPNPC